jgi:hypothetical protein
MRLPRRLVLGASLAVAGSFAACVFGFRHRLLVRWHEHVFASDRQEKWGASLDKILELGDADDLDRLLDPGDRERWRWVKPSFEQSDRAHLRRLLPIVLARAARTQDERVREALLGVVTSAVELTLWTGHTGPDDPICVFDRHALYYWWRDGTETSNPRPRAPFAWAEWLVRHDMIDAASLGSLGPPPPGEAGVAYGIRGRALEGRVLVKEVAPGMPGDRAGLQPEDEIVSVDGNVLPSIDLDDRFSPPTRILVRRQAATLTLTVDEH